MNFCTSATAKALSFAAHAKRDEMPGGFKYTPEAAVACGAPAAVGHGAL